MADTPTTSQTTYSIDDLATAVKQRRPDLQQLDNRQIVSSLIQHDARFQNYLKTEDLQSFVNPNAPKSTDQGVLASAEALPKAIGQFFYGLGKAAVTPPKAPTTMEGIKETVATSLAGPGGLIYKRAFLDPADQAKAAAEQSGRQGDPLGVIQHSAEAAINYLGPAGFAGKALAGAIFTPQIAGAGAAQVGQGDVSGGVTTAALGIFAPEVLGKVGEKFKSKPTTTAIEAPQVEPTQRTAATALKPEVAQPTSNVPLSPDQHIEAAGLVNKGELVKGSGVHMVEHPDFPGVTKAINADELTSPDVAKQAMAGKLDEFAAKPLDGQDPARLKAAASELRGQPAAEVSKQFYSDKAAQLNAVQASPQQLAETFNIDKQRLEAARRTARPEDRPLIDERLLDIQDNLKSLGQPQLDKFQEPLTPQSVSDPSEAPRFQGADSPMRPYDPQGTRFAQGGTQGMGRVSLSPEHFPLEEFSQHMDSIDRADRTLKKPDLAASQKSYFENLMGDLRSGVAGKIGDWMAGTPDHLLPELELKRVRAQIEDVKSTLEHNKLAKSMREEMRPRPERPWASEFKLGNVDEGGTFHELANPLPGVLRDKFHHLLGDEVANIPSTIPDEKWTDIRQAAKAQLEEAKGALDKRIEDIVTRTGDTQATKGELLNRALNEEKLVNGRDIKSEVKTLQSILGTGRERLRYLNKGEAAVDAQGVVRAPGTVKEMTLDYARKVLDRKVRQIPSEAEWNNVHIPQMEARAALLEKVVEKAKERRAGFNGESGKVGEARRPTKKSSVTPDEQIRDSALMRKEAMKHADLSSWEINDEHPASAYGLISPDGKLWVEGEPGLEHQDIARRLLKDIDYSKPEEGPLNQLMNQGWIRKASSTEYQSPRLGSRQVNAIEMSMIRDGRFGKDAIIDTVGPRGIKAIHIESGWTDLAPEIDKIKRSDPAWREQAGVGAIEPMVGSTLGMTTLGAVGYHVAGAPGAVVGGAVGFVTGFAAPAILRNPFVRAVITSLGDEITKMAYSVGSGTKQVATDLTHFLAPRMGVSEKALTTIYAMKGGIAEAAYNSGKLLDVYREHVEKLPRDAQIDFIDRMKTGSPQISPELDELAKSIRAIDQHDYEQIKEYRPGLPFLENHYRLLYEQIPGQTDAGFKGWLGKRPLQGSKGMLNQHVYDTLSDAIANGGKPVTTNPIDMFLMGHVDAQRFVHAQAMWETSKALGLREFVKMGEKPSPGMVQLDDSIAKVYFPAQSGEGLVHSGTHYVDEGLGRLLNNYLSKDYVRANVLGKKIVDIKNIATGWELMGPFHGVAMGLAATSANFGLGMQRAFNLGMRGLDGRQFARGVEEMVKSPTAARSVFLDGRNLQEFGDAINRYKNGDAQALHAFSSSEAGQKFLQKYPDAEGLLGDAFMGGLNMKMSDDVRSNITKSMMQNFRDKEYIAGTAKAPLAAMNRLMMPLFDIYIPRIKLGMFLKDMSLQLREGSSDILSGKTTREEISRKVVDRTENFFGEMNFDNLFWNKTFKTSMQMLYRSVTWRLGTLRLLKDAIKGQGADILEGVKTGTVPRLNPNLGYLAGETLVVGAVSAVIMRSLAGKYPQNITDLLHPQTGDKDSRGKPVRVNVPAYMSRDIPEILGSPTGIIKYATGGNSAIIQRAIESWNNKNFAGEWVANPNDPEYKKFAAKMFHLLPDWMMGQTMDRLDNEGASRDRRVLAYAGFAPARKSLDMSPAELLAQEKMIATLPANGRDPQKVQKSIALGQILASIQNNRGNAGDLFRENLKKGVLTGDDLKNVTTRLTTPYLTQLLSNNDIKLEDVLSVFKVATPQEKQQLKPILIKKIGNLMTIPEERRGQAIQDLRNALQTPTGGR